MTKLSTEPEAIDLVDYPSEDGKPLAETDFQLNAIIWLKEALEDLRDSRGQVAYVPADMFWYWEQGNAKASIAPDVMFIPGVGKHFRNSFFSWKEDGRIPAVVFEVASKNTWREDIGKKLKLYEKLGVPEYFIFDPLDQYIQPALWGFRLDNGRYVKTLDMGEGLLSTRLNARLVPEDVMLRVVDLGNGEPVLTRLEVVEKAEAALEQSRAVAKRAQAAAKSAHKAMDKANEENARLKELLRRAGIADPGEADA